MKLSPTLIKNQEFKKSMRGFDVAEVQAFLEKVATDFEELIEENENLKQSLEEIDKKVMEFQRQEKIVRDTLVKAQDSSTKAMESTKKQTSLIIKEAELKASHILENAKRRADEIKNSVQSAEQEKNLIVAKLKAIISSQAQLLEGKLKDAGEEKNQTKKAEQKENININVDAIVKKLI